ncbi:MAG: AAA family ATPase [Gammaproteobacteria bacterium]|uniref:AAA family ATPase n=1 Tax=Shewanella baltica TaxID=62322 RepID=UPI001DBCE355|nr:AAA family ATPase [Gammaproteobacteria bacterium]MBU1476252.1 AAA family ATPase [Gammaproteobacteria bacterium]MBU2000744.1 AAA family ATPase [Gammaproteobacteria bacterium]MBU2131245.1 AAA family ATPase [Gammaproteobacteria bacterium]MBU2188430.1 AAA family ATPase [Gammaproteobacteria bacterium]
MENYIKKVIIKGLFESGNDYNIDLSDGCNCMFGGNGTGKTTIINLIVNSLGVDLEALSSVPFESLSIRLAKTGQKRSFELFSLVRKVGEDNRRGIITLRYDVKGRKIQPFIIRPREIGERLEEKYGVITDDIKSYLMSKVSLTHVPLLRMHDSELFSVRDERDEYLHSALRSRRISQSQITEIMDPSVRVLSNLQRQFINQANETRKEITDKLEKLKSQIIEKVMIDSELVGQVSKAFNKISNAIHSNLNEVDVDVEGYVRKLQDAGINVPEDKLKEHFGMWKHLNESVKKNFDEMRQKEANVKSTDKQKTEASQRFNSSYFSLFAMTHFHDRFLSIVKDVENMQEEKYELTKSFRDYEVEVNKYLNGKKVFSLTSDGKFHVRSGSRNIRMSELSSGEKHILSILGKAALSSDEGAVFVADEPELSLHLDWQRMILPSIIKLSPKSQVIVATHSPSIYAVGATEIDLEECV